MQDREHGHPARSSAEPTGHSPEKRDADSLPFEAWHFQRSAMVHHLVLSTGLVYAFVMLMSFHTTVSRTTVLSPIVGVCVLAGRAAAHAWLEPASAQKLVSRLAFGCFAASILLDGVGAEEGVEARRYLSEDVLVIPMGCFLCTTFPFTRIQMLFLALLHALLDGRVLYTASTNWTVRIFPWASNATVGLTLSLDYVGSVALFFFFIDAQNREAYRVLLQGSLTHHREHASSPGEIHDHIVMGLDMLRETKESPVTYMKLNEAAGTPSIATDPQSFIDVEAYESTSKPEASDAVDLPFEAWHFRRSAMVQYLVLGAMVALWMVYAVSLHDTVDSSAMAPISLGLCVLAGRAAAHAWLEPVFAQKLVSHLAFGIGVVCLLLECVAQSPGGQQMQAMFTLDMLFIPMSCFLCTTFPFTRMQSLFMVMLMASLEHGRMIYVASAHWTVAAVPWASNGTLALTFGLVYAGSALFLFMMDAHNRRKHLEDRRHHLELEEARCLIVELERARRSSLAQSHDMPPPWTRASCVSPSEVALLHLGKLPEGVWQLGATEGRERVSLSSEPPRAPSESPPPSLPPGPPSRSGRSSSTSDSRRRAPEALGAPAAETNPFASIYDSVVSLMRMHEVPLPAVRERVRTNLRPQINALLTADAVGEFETLVVQLIMLKRVHTKLGPEASFAKLHTISAAMSEQCLTLGSHGRLLIDKLRSYVTRMVLRYGALAHVTEDDFTLPEDEVGALLNRYQWAGDSTRTHVHHIIRKSLRAVASFRAAAATALATASVPEANATLTNAQDELFRAMNRVLEEHGMQADPTMELAPMFKGSNAQAGTPLAKASSGRHVCPPSLSE